MRQGGGSLAGKKAVVIGGGTGAPRSIGALLSLGATVSAVVAMTDDGGSSGILRERAGAIPPGDIRKCLVAMATDPEAPIVRAFRYRFDYANNHALGNLVITALADTGSTFPEAIAVCEDLLNARGHVYPSTLEDVKLSGITRDGVGINGQSAVCHSNCALRYVEMDPASPPAYEPALDAIAEADLIVLGPGSLFTSIIPNLLVAGIPEAIAASDATTVFVCSLADMQGETWGLSCAEHVEALLDHGMRGLLDYAFIHAEMGCAEAASDVSDPSTSFQAVTGISEDPYRMPAHRRGIRRVAVNPVLITRIEQQGPKAIVRDFVDAQRPTWHSMEALAEGFIEVI